MIYPYITIKVFLIYIYIVFSNMIFLSIFFINRNVSANYFVYFFCTCSFTKTKTLDMEGRTFGGTPDRISIYNTKMKYVTLELFYPLDNISTESLTTLFFGRWFQYFKCQPNVTTIIFEKS